MHAKNTNKHKTVLVVEDEVCIRRAVAIIFKNANYNVLQAEDGERGLEMALKERPDLLVLDVVMPNMSGIEMLKRVRKNAGWGARVPVLFYTNIDNGNDEVEAIKHGAEHFLTKTETPLRELVDISTEVLNNYQ